MSQWSLFNSRHYQLLLWFRLGRYTNSILSTNAALGWVFVISVCCAGFCKLFLWVISTNTYIRPDSRLQKCQRLFLIHDSACRLRRLEVMNVELKHSILSLTWCSLDAQTPQLHKLHLFLSLSFKMTISRAAQRPLSSLYASLCIQCNRCFLVMYKLFVEN